MGWNEVKHELDEEVPDLYELEDVQVWVRNELHYTWADNTSFLYWHLKFEEAEERRMKYMAEHDII